MSAVCLRLIAAQVFYSTQTFVAQVFAAQVFAAHRFFAATSKGRLEIFINM